MPKTKEQYEKIRDEKRTLIKETAFSLFAEKGYAMTSISDIAKRAGISKGLMYNYFLSKEELLKVIWDELLNRFDNIIDTNNDGKISDSEAEFFIDQFFDMLKHRREEFKLYYQLSFQPQVVEFLMKTYDSEKQQRQRLMFAWFASRLKFPVPEPEFGLFSVVVFLKGLSMVSTYTEGVYSNEFLDRYKDFLKRFLFTKLHN